MTVPFHSGGVRIDSPGRFGERRAIGGWPNLVEVADLALRHFNEICDPSRGYMSYMGGSLGYGTPAFTRSMWDWVEASSYALPGRIAARRLTGGTAGHEVEIGQRKLTLAAFHDLDGFAHRTYARGWSEDGRVILWEQARVLFTLMAWFMESEDERLLHYVRGMLDALRRISRIEGGQRIFQDVYWRGEATFGDAGPVVLVEPLMKYHELTGDVDALDFCAGIVNWVTAPQTRFVDEQYRFSGWLRGLAAPLASIVRYAAFTGEQAALSHAKRMFDAASSLTSRFGATPDSEPCCTNMELTTAALALARAGHTHYWDDVDRWFRNHTLECQLCDPRRIKTGCVEGGPEPADDCRNILERSVGGFSWATARSRLVNPGMLMVCCGGNAMWTMGKIVANSAVEDADGLTVNLHFSLDTPAAFITNHEPFEGRLEIVPRQSGRVRIRKPSYAGTIDSAVDGAPARPGAAGEYLVFDRVTADSRIVLTYALPERVTDETTMNTPFEGPKHRSAFQQAKSDPVVKERIRATWRGNTVLAIDYDEQPEHPREHGLYFDRMEQFRKGAGRDATARFFLPERPFDW